MIDIRNRVIVLTGGFGFLGKEYCKRFNEMEATTIVIDLQHPPDDFQRKHNVFWFGADITDKFSVDAIFKQIKHHWGRVDVLINNAAAHQTTYIGNDNTKFEDFPLDVWQKNLDVNLTGTFLCSQAAVAMMKEQGYGNILNIGSVYGVVGCDQRIYGNSKINSSAAYAATKSGVIGLTKYLAAYLHGTGIRVNSLSPGGVFNNQDEEFVKNYEEKTMLHRMARPEDIVNAVLYLISDASAWVTGSNLVVDGGWTAW